MAEIIGGSGKIEEVEGQYNIVVKDVDPMGTKTQEISVPLTNSVDWQKWGLMMRTAILKKTIFKNLTIPEIVFGVVYADKLGLDIIAGDLFNIEGKWATSNSAKIKYAMRSGKIEGYTVDIKPILNGNQKPKLFTVARKQFGKEIEVTLEDKIATVSVKVKDWPNPVTYQSILSQWVKPSNPNWVERPDHMHRLNSLAHALAEIVPIGTDNDEAPPVAEFVPDLGDVLKK